MTSNIFLGLCATVIMATLGAPRLSQAQGAVGDVTVLTIIDVVPDYAMPQNVEKSAALLRKLSADTQNAPGVVSFKILRDATRSNHFVIDAIWKDMKSFETYSGAETTRKFRQAFQPGQGGPFDERIYVDLK